MRRAVLPLLILLAACGREAPVPEAASFRDRSLPIASTTRGGPGEMAGEWVVSAAYPGAGFAQPGTRVTLVPGAGGSLGWAFRGAGGERVVPTAMTLPGRYEAGAAALPFLVLWVDDDFRTAVVGTPDGTFGWIMDRPGQASPDRAAAAREVLDFNGYDVTRLAGG